MKDIEFLPLDIVHSPKYNINHIINHNNNINKSKYEPDKSEKTGHSGKVTPDYFTFGVKGAEPETGTGCHILLNILVPTNI